MEEEMVECWVECSLCPNRSPGKWKPKKKVEASEAMGFKLRPAIGVCPDCQAFFENDESGVAN